jgi:hypothetical protein
MLENAPDFIKEIPENTLRFFEHDPSIEEQKIMVRLHSDFFYYGLVDTTNDEIIKIALSSDPYFIFLLDSDKQTDDNWILAIKQYGDGLYKYCPRYGDKEFEKMISIKK